MERKNSLWNNLRREKVLLEYDVSTWEIDGGESSEENHVVHSECKYEYEL